MWVESQLHVGEDSIGVSVQRLDPDECERTAATLAWLTLETMRSGSDLASGPWQAFVNGLLSQHVAFVVPEGLADADSAWWTEAVGRALSQFVRENDLAATINRHLQLMQGAAVDRRLHS